MSSESPPTTLWRHPDFMKLWVGQTVSQFGAQITMLALPLTAVLLLHASPAQMGVLGAMEMAPFLLIGLFAGVYVDRVRRRPLLVAADVGRALLLATVPVMALFHLLEMPVLYGLGFLVGSLTVLFDVAYQSYLPALVSRKTLVEGNSKLEMSRAVAQIGGPGVAGVLIQWVTAPMALAANSLTYVVSVASLLWIRGQEPPAAPSGGKGVWADIGEGLTMVVGNPLLRSIAGCTATANFFGSAAGAVLMLYLVHKVGLTPGLLGVVFAAGSAGALAGAAGASRIAGWLGLGRAIWMAIALTSVAGFLVPMATAPPSWGLPVLVVSYILQSVGSTVYNINQVSLRQAITPGRLLGRMNASMRFIVWGVMPLGSLVGGAAGTVLGLRPTLWVMATLAALAPLWVYRSPVRHLMSQPEPLVVEAG